MERREAQAALEAYAQRAVACPHCGAPHGRPVKVITTECSPEEGNQVNIIMGCSGCMRTWFVQKPAQKAPPASA